MHIPIRWLMLEFHERAEGSLNIQIEICAYAKGLDSNMRVCSPIRFRNCNLSGNSAETTIYLLMFVHAQSNRIIAHLLSDHIFIFASTILNILTSEIIWLFVYPHSRRICAHCRSQKKKAKLLFALSSIHITLHITSSIFKKHLSELVVRAKCNFVLPI